VARRRPATDKGAPSAYKAKRIHITEFDPLSQQQQQIFPTIDLNLAPQWEVNFGLGVGLTGATDHLIGKMILGYRFNF
jgi:hypothetical protein